MKYSEIVFHTVVLSCAAGFFSSQAFAIKDKDWSHNFYQSCPSQGKSKYSMLKEKDIEFLRFEVNAGERGGCRADNNKRSGYQWHERIELTAGYKGNMEYLYPNKSYEIKYRIRFAEWTNQWTDSINTILQVYNNCYKSDKKGSCKPAYILSVDKGNRLRVRTQHASGKDYYLNHIDLESEKTMGNFIVHDHIGKWVDVTINLDMKKDHFNMVTKVTNGDEVWSAKSDKIVMRKGKKPYIKFGIYRGGREDNARSVLDVDFIKINAN
jgi:hypothetical protein